MNENAYREAAEMPPEPVKKKPSWISEQWEDYKASLKTNPNESVAIHIVALLVIGVLVTIVWGLVDIVGEGIRQWRSPCAEYVNVPQQTTTVDGTPVTIQVKKCLRLK